MRILTAEDNKVFAYKDEQGNEVVLGSMLYLGKNDNGSRYYQVEKMEVENNGDNNKPIQRQRRNYNADV